MGNFGEADLTSNKESSFRHVESEALLDIQAEMSRRYLHPWVWSSGESTRWKNMGTGSCVAVELGEGCEVLASLLQAWSAPPAMGDCFDLCSEVLVDTPCWACFCNRDNHQLEPTVFFSNEARIGNSGRDWMAWLWSKGHFPLIECLTTLPPSMKSSSLILPTLVTPLYWAQAFWKDPLYSLSSEKSRHLREWQSRRSLEEDLRELWTLYWSAPNSELKEANLVHS